MTFASESTSLFLSSPPHQKVPLLLARRSSFNFECRPYLFLFPLATLSMKFSLFVFFITHVVRGYFGKIRNQINDTEIELEVA